MNLARMIALGFVAGSVLCAPLAVADETDTASSTSSSFIDAILDGEFSASLRYRYAHIDQAGFAEDAEASTIQILLGYETGIWEGLSAFGQLRNVSVLGSERYNSTVNGLAQYPVEADPDTTEVDQLFVRYAGLPNLTVTVGRRKLNWGNQRFVSALGWRQNNRSFDGIVVESTPVNDLSFRYAYSLGVNRAFTDESPVGNFDGDFHLFNLVYGGLEHGTLTGYAYVNDFDDAFALGLSSQTYGANFTGSTTVNDLTLGMVLEYAHQSDFGNHPSSYDAYYFRVEPSVSAHGLTLRGGLEILDGDGTNSFKTPLALLHAYNGWADQFLVTPGAGLQDVYGSASYRFGSDTPEFLDGVRVTVAYHDFQAEESSMSYGTEWDGSIVVPLGDHFSTSLKFASYSADGFRVDTEKVWWIFTARY